MPKFKHQDEEDYDVFCEFCQVEHSASIPETVCRKNIKKAKDQYLEEQRLTHWDREDEKRKDWE